MDSPASHSNSSLSGPGTLLHAAQAGRQVLKSGMEGYASE